MVFMLKPLAVVLLGISLALLCPFPAPAAPPIYNTGAEASLKPGMDVPEPSSPVVLTVDRKIRMSRPVRFDLPNLEAVGLIQFATSTSWTTSPSLFEGVRLAAVLDVAGADPAATTLVLTSLNDLQIRVPIADARTWPVMLALRRDGSRLSRRDRGPIWVVYPQHAFPELDHRTYHQRWLDQLKSITVE